MKWVIMIGCLFGLAGCQADSSDEDLIRILLFADEAAGQEENIEQALADQIETDKPIDVSIYPLSREKFSVLLAERAGDVYIADPILLKGLLNKNGLTPLDDVMPVSDYPFVQEFYTENEKTGERHLYGLPVQTDRSIFAHMDLAMPDKLTGIIPSFSSNQKESVAALRAFID